MYQDFDSEKIHIEIFNSNEKYDIGFLSAVLKECGVNFELDNQPIIASVDDLIKCLDEALKHKLNNSKGEPVEAPIYKLYEVCKGKLFGMENMDYQSFLDIDSVKEELIECDKMFSLLMQDGYANIAYMYYPIFDFFAEHNPKLEMKLCISFPSGKQEDEMIILNNGEVKYVSMAKFFR